MHASDNKQFPLAKAKRPAQTRRAVSKKDFRLPKPYRRQLFSEEPERLTRMQVSVLSFAALMVTTLVGVLALLAHESDLSPEGKMIVAAARLETVQAAQVQPVLSTAPDAPAEAAIAPARQHAPPVSVPAYAVPPPVLPTRLAAKSGGKVRPATRVANAPAARFAVTVPAPDPDVTLIAAILLLTPAPVPTSAPPVAMELAGRAQAPCAAFIPKDPACPDLLTSPP
ncbi:MAG: hypothetical protein WKG03_11785 [Telluria sp.]